MSEQADLKLPKSLTELPDAPPEEYPRAFGNYMLLAPLARGGMGEVFLAKHGSVRGLEKHCVVKTLRPHLTDDREYTVRFIDEARIVVQLGHRNICHVFDVGTVGERYYLAMEYIAGKDLRALTHDVGEKGGVVNPGLALHMACEVLEALDYAHRHKDAATGKPLLLVHRDVSPQNVMLSWEGEVKLIDFGLAASTLKMEQTSPNVVMGKLAYMAPEQVRGERVDGRADMFAVAVMLYEMLVGERFYEGRSPYEIWGLAAQGNFRPRGWGALDEEMRAILDKALAGPATARHGTCLELREALQGYRFAKGLHGDAPMLRALMQQVYAKEIEESHQHLVTLSQASPKDPLARHPSGVFTVSTEPTLSIARSPSSSQTAPPMMREPTEPTEMAVKAMFGPKRQPRLAAGLVVAGMLLGVAGLVWTLNSTHPPPRSPDVKPVETKPVDPTPVETPAETKPETKPVELPDLEVKPADPKPKVKRPLEVKAVEKPVEKPVEVTPVEKPAEVKPLEVKPLEARPDAGETGGTWGPYVDALVAKCPEQTCTQDVKGLRSSYGRVLHDDPPRFKAWKAKVKACMAVCGVPEKN